MAGGQISNAIALFIDIGEGVARLGVSNGYSLACHLLRDDVQIPGAVFHLRHTAHLDFAVGLERPGMADHRLCRDRCSCIGERVFRNGYRGGGRARFRRKGRRNHPRQLRHQHGIQYHDVVGYHVLLKAADDKVVETSFEDDDFNIYPSKNAVIYPGVGDHFTVYYLRRFPDDFIIVDDDDSPWATALRCGKLRDAVQEANAKYEFDHGNTSYRTAYVAVINDLLDNKCVADESERDEFRHDLENVRAGQP
jgi:hypothetical protein